MNSTNDLKKLQVEDLIALMADQSQEPHRRDRIFCEFYYRFINYGFSVARNSMATKQLFDEDECTVIVHNCFLAVNEKAGVFKAAPEGKSEKEKHKRVLGWIATIIRNGVKQYVINQDKLKNKTIFAESPDDYRKVVEPINDEEEVNLPPNAYMLQLKEAISHLNPVHWEITATYLCWEDENGDIPPDILARMNRKYRLLPKYAGKITNRTIEKLFKLNPLPDTPHTNEVETAKERREKIRAVGKDLPPIDWEDFPGNTGTS